MKKPLRYLLMLLLALALSLGVQAQSLPPGTQYDEAQVEAILRGLSPEQRQRLREQLREVEGDSPSGTPVSPSGPSPSPSPMPAGSDAEGQPEPPRPTLSPPQRRGLPGIRMMDTLEKERAQRRENDLKSLERFGSSFFERSLEELSDSDELTIPDDYRLVKGDQMNLTSYNVRGGETIDLAEVDEQGQFFLTGVGPVNVEGLTKSQVDTRLNAMLTSQFPNLRVRTTFVKVRKIRVFVLGEAVRPGGFLMNPNATVLDALLLAGGPADSGSYRKIRLERGGRPYAQFDLYDLLLNGKTGSPRLQHGDRIFVPLVGPEVAVAGEVMRPARYELRQEKTVGGVIALAGGLRPQAYKPLIKLERLAGNAKRQLIDLAFEEARSTPIHPGDFVYLAPVLEDLANGVYVEGAIKRPGWYQLTPGMKVSSLVRQAEGLEDGAFAGLAELYRIDSPSEPLRMVGFDLGRALAGDPTQDLVLKSEDRVVVYSREQALVDKERVRIQGEIKQPGEYARFTNMKVKDLITLAGGVTPEASMEAEIARPMGQGKISLIPVDLDTILKSPESEANLVIRDLDTLVVRKEMRSRRWPASVTLVGEFKRPGVYSVDPDRETLADVVERAGGLSDLAYPRAAVFTRELPSLLAKEQNTLAKDVFADLQEIARQIALVENTRQGRRRIGVGGQVDFTQLSSSAVAPPRKLDSILSTGRVPLELQEIIKNRQGDPRVKDGDMLFVPQQPEMVIVSGAVVLPSPMVWRPHRGVDEYIDLAGGFAEDAAHDKVLVLRVNGSLVRSERAGHLEPGDMILVPPKALVARPSAFEQFLNVLQVIANGAFIWRVFD